jgi:hypothetical protein
VRRRTDAGRTKVTDGGLTLRDAAIHLGISEGAVRKRVARGTMRSELGEDGKRYVYLDTGTDGGADASSPHESTTVNSAQDELIAELRDRVRSLEEQMQAERDANRENRRIIAALTSRIPEIEAPSEPRESPKGATEQPGRVEPQPSVGGEQEPAERRSWWRRMFGG